MATEHEQLAVRSRNRRQLREMERRVLAATGATDLQVHERSGKQTTQGMEGHRACGSFRTLDARTTALAQVTLELPTPLGDIRDAVDRLHRLLVNKACFWCPESTSDMAPAAISCRLEAEKQKQE